MATYTIQNILAPLDLSDSSLNAVEVAGALAQATGATLHLLYIEERLDALDTPFGPALNPQWSHNDVLPALAATLATKYQLRINLLMKEGNVTETIIQTTQEQSADLVVMGKHGASGIRDGFAGHNTYYTIKHSHVPVLAVPASCPQGLFPHVVYPFRLMDGAQMRHDLVLPFISTGATIELLSVNQKLLDIGNRALHFFADQVQEKSAEKRVLVKMAQGTGLHIGRELVHYASRNERALVVANSALDMNGNSRFIGPHTQAAINGLKNPLLFVPLHCEQITRTKDPAFHYTRIG